jgi:uncharacterized protein (DUF433 family)
MNYQDYITINADKRGGKPCVRGWRIIVYEVLDYLASDMRKRRFWMIFPTITRKDLKVCIAFTAARERKLMTIPAALILVSCG